MDENKTKESNTNKPLKSLSGLISFITAILPILLFIICIVLSDGEGENGAGAIFWLLGLYLWFAGIPVYIISVLSGIYGIKGKTKVLSILGLLVDIILLGLVVFVLFLM